MKETRRLLTLIAIILLPATLGLTASGPWDGDVVASSPDTLESEGIQPLSPQFGSTTKGAVPNSAAAFLTMLDAAQRENALVELEPVGATRAAWPLPDAAEVADLWNSGSYDQAILSLQQLEDAGVQLAPAITWKVPVGGTQQRWYGDVPIGEGRVDSDDVHLDFHRGTGHLYAAVSWETAWTMNISTDGGATWQETALFGTKAKISMKVGGNYAWVAYSLSSTPTEMRVRRCYATSGAFDSVYGHESVANINPATVVDVAITSNADDADTATYLGFIGSDNVAYFFWDDYVGTSFTSFHPPIANAVDNLDFTMNPFGFWTSGYIGFISFENTTGEAEVWRLSFIGTWDHVRTYALTGQGYTAISAYKDTVMLVYQTSYTNGNGIKYRVSYDNGETWAQGDVYQPGSGDDPALSPDVSLRSGRGIAVTYLLEAGDRDEAYVRHRPGLANVMWESPVRFDNYDSATALQTTVEWLGATCVGSYGMSYIGTGFDFIPYFDLTDPRGFFCDGFNSGNTTAWD